MEKLDLTAASSRVDAVLDEVFAGIQVLSDLAAALHKHALAENRKPSTHELASIRETVLAHLHRGTAPIAGTGVIAAPDSLADEPRWLEWWRTESTGAEPQWLDVDLDPGNVAGYEYTSAPWFTTPRKTNGRVVVGPYVDFAGTDEYILTFGAPVLVDGRFVGVAGADMRTTDLEQEVLPTLSAIGAGTLLLNAHARVIASNTPTAIVGSLVSGDRRSVEDLAAIGTSVSDCTGLPWSLTRIQ